MPPPLPIDAHVGAVRAALASARAAVLVAPPGSGKTTRVPPALAADGPVFLLQPRRVAARSIARRIADEQGWSLGGEVGWQVRFERRFGRDTRLLVATEGVLTRRLQSDPLLTALPDDRAGRVPRAQPARRPRAGLRSAGLARPGRPAAARDVRDSRRGARRALPRRLPGDRRAGAAAPDRGEIRAGTDADRGRAHASREIGRTRPLLPARGPGDPKSTSGARGSGRGPRAAVTRNVVVRRPGPCARALGRAQGDSRHERGRDVADRRGRDGRDRLGPAQGDALRRVAGGWTASSSSASPRTRPSSARGGRGGRGRAASCGSGTSATACVPGASRRSSGWTSPGRSSRCWRGEATLPVSNGSRRRRPRGVEAAMRLLERLGAVADRRLTHDGEAMHRLPLHPRLARVLLSAGGGERAASVGAVLGEGWRPAVFGEPPTTDSDVLSAADRFAEAPPGVRAAARELERLTPSRSAAIRNGAEGSSMPADSSGRMPPASLGTTGDGRLLRALLAGFPDRVARRREPSSSPAGPQLGHRRAPRARERGAGGRAASRPRGDRWRGGGGFGAGREGLEPRGARVARGRTDRRRPPLRRRLRHGAGLRPGLVRPASPRRARGASGPGGRRLAAGGRPRAPRARGRGGATPTTPPSRGARGRPARSRARGVPGPHEPAVARRAGAVARRPDQGTARLAWPPRGWPCPAAAPRRSTTARTAR